MIIIKDVILVILVITIIYLIYKKTKGLNNEKFSSTYNSDSINKAVNEIYKIDIDAMRNLGSISNNILTDNTLNLPASKVHIKGDLSTNSSVIFNNKNIMENYPRYMILPWGGTKDNIPKGWAQCDGSKYKIDTTTGISYITSNADGIQTPDLRGRFIIQPGTNNDNFQIGTPFNNKNGSNKHTLTADELPSHFHYQFIDDMSPGNSLPLNTENASAYTEYNNQNNDSYLMASDGTDAVLGKTSSTGNNTSFSIMPPYCVLIYIMKI